MGIHFDLVDMKLFINVAKSHSLTQAAADSFMSLPAASIRVRLLEEKFGAKLLYRQTRGVELTAAGKAFLRFATITMKDIDCLVDEVQTFANGVRGHLRVLADMSSMELLPGVLAAFLQEHPGVSVNLKEYGSREIAPALRDGAADIGIVAVDAPMEGLQARPYRQDRMVLATPRRHILAGKKTVFLDETLAYDHVEVAELHASRRFPGDATPKARQPVKARVQVGHLEALCRMVAAGVGVGVLPESAALRYAKELNIVIVPLADEWADLPSSICCRSFESLPDFAHQLIDVLVENAAREAAGLPSHVLNEARMFAD